jgi:hypothetical protein
MNEQACPWKQINFGLFLTCITFVFNYAAAVDLEWYLPIKTQNRQSLEKLTLTPIGAYGAVRKPRPGVPSHLHTGIDIKRPSENYADEPVFPACRGVIISLRDDGPFAQVVVEHHLNNSVRVWTVYEHIAGITSVLGDTVFPEKPFARFMNKNELNKLGWQFDHVHFEILRKSPIPLKPGHANPFRRFNTYGLTCYDGEELNAAYYDPCDFFRNVWLKK